MRLPKPALWSTGVIGFALMLALPVLTFHASGAGEDCPLPEREAPAENVRVGSMAALAAGPAGQVEEGEPPLLRTRTGVLAREMIHAIAANLIEKGSQRKLKAYYDAIRGLGPQAVPVLAFLLRGAGAPEYKLAALNALTGLRFMARSIPEMRKEGMTPEQMSEKLGVPAETVRDFLAAGAWAPDMDKLMAGGAWEIVRSGASMECRENAISMLVTLDDRGPLMEFIRDAKDEPELRDHALTLAVYGLRPDEAGMMADLAADAGNDLEFRFKTGLACLGTAGQDAVRASLLQPALSAIRDPDAPPVERVLAVRLYGGLEKERAHAELFRILDDDTSDDLRFAALIALNEMRGLEAARGRIEAIAAEPTPSNARTAAQKLLTVLPERP